MREAESEFQGQLAYWLLQLQSGIAPEVYLEHETRARERSLRRVGPRACGCRRLHFCSAAARTVKRRSERWADVVANCQAFSEASDDVQTRVGIHCRWERVEVVMVGRPDVSQ